MITSTEKPPIYLVDENDKIIGEGDRDTIDFAKSIYRVASVLVFNRKGDMLIAQRKLTKKKDPGMWGPSVAGTVEVGETYGSNALKETAEEIGIENAQLTPIDKHRRADRYNYFCQVYKTVVDLPVEGFTPQEDEVEALAWADVATLRKKVEQDPGKYVPGFIDVVAIAERQL